MEVAQVDFVPGVVLRRLGVCLLDCEVVGRCLEIPALVMRETEFASVPDLGKYFPLLQVGGLQSAQAVENSPIGFIYFHFY